MRHCTKPLAAAIHAKARSEPRGGPRTWLTTRLLGGISKGAGDDLTAEYQERRHAAREPGE